MGDGGKGRVRLRERRGKRKGRRGEGRGIRESKGEREGREGGGQAEVKGRGRGEQSDCPELRLQGP